LALGGCHVNETRYQTPPTPAPAAYDGAVTAEATKEWKAAAPSDATPKGAWWTVYEDATLNALEERLTTDNLTLQAAEARFREARALVHMQRADRLPTVDATASIARTRTSANRLLPAPPGQTDGADFALGFQAAWEPDLWGRIRTQIASATASAQATAAEHENARLSLQAELALDYFDLRSLDAELRVLQASVEAYRKALELTENRYQGGAANRAEVAEARTQVEATQAQVVGLAAQRAQYEHAIAVLTGRVPEGFSIAATDRTLVTPVTPVGLPSELLERRPDIAAAERRVAAANSAIFNARAAFYPRVMLAAAAGLEGRSITNWLNWPSRLWAIGPSAAQTLFDAGRRRAVLDASTANYDATVAEYRASVLNAFQQVEDNLSALRVLDDQMRQQARAVAAARDSEEASMNRYRGGLVTYLEVATAQTVRLQNERVAVAIERQRMEASVLLIRALGGGWNASTLPTTAALAAK
jgi:NodT family efflux transporter outer membrane factor (OMF) lipoprotein